MGRSVLNHLDLKGRAPVNVTTDVVSWRASSPESARITHDVQSTPLRPDLFNLTGAPPVFEKFILELASLSNVIVLPRPHRCFGLDGMLYRGQKAWSPTANSSPSAAIEYHTQWSTLLASTGMTIWRTTSSRHWSMYSSRRAIPPVTTAAIRVRWAINSPDSRALRPEITFCRVLPSRTHSLYKLSRSRFVSAGSSVRTPPGNSLSPNIWTRRPKIVRSA